MSKGNSIFSSPNGSNGEAPANPFASLGSGSQKSSAASPFAAAPAAEPESPFGFAAEEAEAAQTKLPEKRSQTPMPAAGDNPFMSAASAPAPKAEAQAPPAAQSPASPFTSESSFEAPARPASAGFGSGENPLSASTPEPAAPAPEPARAEQPVSRPAEPAPQQHSPAPTPAAQTREPAAAPMSSPQAAAPPSGGGGGGQSTRQLELRAIFGVEGEMTRDQILTRAKGLPGLREVTVVGPAENAAVQTMGEVMARFGFGGSGSWQMSCSGGVVDFISAENATLAVLREGRYSAGVWETLMIVARELGKLS